MTLTPATTNGLQESVRDFRVQKKFQINAERSLNAAKLLGRLVEIAAKCRDEFVRTLVAFVHQRFDGAIGILLMEQEPVNVWNRDICFHVPENFKAGLDGELRRFPLRFARRMNLAGLTMREIPSQIMSIKKLKSAVEEHRDRLSTKKGKVCTFGKNGPVGMQVIDALVEALEAQEQRIQELEKKLSS